MTKHILIVLFLVNTSLSCSQDLNEKAVLDFVNKMMISNDHESKVIKISEVRKNVCIALIDLPYREFPNILIFRFCKEHKEWTRLLEGLNPGIQDKPSGLLDWHTLGLGIDFMTNNDTLVDFNQERVKTMIQSMHQNQGILIPYQNFLHMHTVEGNAGKEFEPYVIDKTRYHELANQLFDNLYTTYPKDECIMFDSPNTVDIDFNYVDGIYSIIAKTDNGQTWTYTFKDIDEDNRYLIDKKIEVKKSY